MKAHIFEPKCPLYQDGALTPIFDGDMPPYKKDPKWWPLYDGHSWRAVNSHAKKWLVVDLFTEDVMVFVTIIYCLMYSVIF
jgi:hypothetical protein